MEGWRSPLSPSSCRITPALAGPLGDDDDGDGNGEWRFARKNVVVVVCAIHNRAINEQRYWWLKSTHRVWPAYHESGGEEDSRVRLRTLHVAGRSTWIVAVEPAYIDRLVRGSGLNRKRSSFVRSKYKISNRELGPMFTRILNRWKT